MKTRFLPILMGALIIGNPCFAQTGSETEGEAPKVDLQTQVRQKLDELVEQANTESSVSASRLVDRMMAAGLRIPANLVMKELPPNDPATAQLRLAEILFTAGNPGFWPEAHSWLGMSVRGGKAAALERQAEILMNGSFGREKAVPRAIELLKKASQIPGVSDAYLHLGNLAVNGIGMPRDGAMAIAYFREGANAGSLRCLIGLHKLYREGKVVEKNLAEAERFGQTAADKNSPEACYQLGVFYERFANGAPNWKQAAKWLEKASQLGHGGASTRLSSYYFNAKLSDKPDPARSLQWCQRAAQQGDAEACFMISRFYIEGKTLSRDAVASTAWLRIGAERGHVQSANELGLRLVSGTGTRRSPTEAVRWFGVAAKAGFPAAWLNLSELYLNGVGVQRDPLKAMGLLESAAKANDPGAQERLARHLARGVGTGQPDPVGAAYWAARLASRNKNAAKFSAQLQSNLTDAQKGELKRRVDDFLNRPTEG